MASRRALQIGGATIAVGGVYYLYSAGGNPAVAEKKLEHDVSAAGARLKGQDLSSTEAQKKGEVFAKEAGATLDRTMHEAGSKVDQLKDEGTKAFNDTSKELKQTADSFDKKVNQKTSEAKSGISSWLGFGK
ncbi:hypothetical protein XANCAGTX0491_006548 [Xanthoria calcicola]